MRPQAAVRHPRTILRAASRAEAEDSEAGELRENIKVSISSDQDVKIEGFSQSLGLQSRQRPFISSVCVTPLKLLSRQSSS